MFNGNSKATYRNSPILYINNAVIILTFQSYTLSYSYSIPLYTDNFLYLVNLNSTRKFHKFEKEEWLTCRYILIFFWWWSFKGWKIPFISKKKTSLDLCRSNLASYRRSYGIVKKCYIKQKHRRGRHGLDKL